LTFRPLGGTVFSDLNLSPTGVNKRPDNDDRSSGDESSRRRMRSGYTGYGDSGRYDVGGGGSYGYGYGQGGNKPLLNRSFQDYVHWYLRHFWVLLLAGGLGLFFGFYVYSITPPVYQSWAVIEVQRMEREAADIDEEEKLSLGGSGVLASIVEKLQMPALFEAVARSNLFASRPEVVRERKEWEMPWDAFFDDGEEEQEASGSVPPPTSLSFMMRNWLTVRWRTQTKLIDLYAKHTDPEVARDVLQGVLSEYERVSQENIGASESYAFEYILEQSDEVKDEILELERSMNRYNRCLELSKRIAEAEMQLVNLEKRYLSKWPEVIEAKELVRILREQFSKELEEVLDSTPEEKRFWEKNFELPEDATQDEIIDAQLKIVEARANLLRKELESEEAILANLTSKLKEGAVSRGFLAKQFTVVQPPTLPSGPVEPSRNAILKKYTVFGLGGGFVLVFLLGLIDPSVRTVADLEGMTGVPVVGALPLGRGEKNVDKKAKTDYDLILAEKANSQQAEALRTLRAGLTYLGDQEERKTFLITSSLASEGKSWISANLALAFAHQGDRTLLIDADLRRAVLHNVFGVEPRSKGLSDFLSGKGGVRDVIHRTPHENLFFLPSGARSPNPAELLASRNLSELLPALEKYFDRIIFDSAPLVLVSDSLSIAKHVQSVLLAYRIGKTPRRALFRALKYLDANHTAPSGIVANQLPAARTRRAYGYYYSFSGGGGYDGDYGGYGASEGEGKRSRGRKKSRDEAEAATGKGEAGSGEAEGGKQASGTTGSADSKSPSSKETKVEHTPPAGTGASRSADPPS